MDNKQLLKIVLVVLALFVAYKFFTSRQSAGSGVSRFVPFDEMPFDTIPPSTGPPQMPPLTNVASDLLPKAVINQVQDFGEFAPKALQGQNFLEVSKQIGIDTQGSSLRNANYQLRADPPNPRQTVGPWANSTIEADLLRKPLE
jgi:hypothetical protein